MSSIAIDTNVLVRLFVNDDEAQQNTAVELLEQAESVIIPTTVLIETVWVLNRSYKIPLADILALLRDFVSSVPKLVVQENEIEAGFAMMERNGDFADGINAFCGAMLGAEQFVTFDKQAARILQETGVKTLLLK
ncbi:type II toxin-antitoxin system VapC family toxin [Neisseria dentiae]|uniref:type II toxin-antitoxin system VapC family toxin n=1 Tax=Neisseria dentiae TaxID=194197 RepID=UPI00359F37A8